LTKKSGRGRREKSSRPSEGWERKRFFKRRNLKGRMRSSKKDPSEERGGVEGEKGSEG